MKIYSSRIIALFGIAAVYAGKVAAGDVVEVTRDAAVQEFCHVLRFPGGWHMPLFLQDKDGSQHLLGRFGLADDYEFRVVVPMDGSHFLVRGVENINRKFYTPEIYEADFSDPGAIAHPISEGTWNSATMVPLHLDTSKDGEMVWSTLKKNGKFDEIKQSGENPDPYNAMRVSPDRTLFVLNSWTGKLGSGGGNDSNPGDFHISFPLGRPHGRLFFDVYEIDTAKKITTIAARFVNILPEAAFGKSVWITERYFLIPLDERRNRCLVCDFGRKH